MPRSKPAKPKPPISDCAVTKSPAQPSGGGAAAVASGGDELFSKLQHKYKEIT